VVPAVLSRQLLRLVLGERATRLMLMHTEQLVPGRGLPT
jgi:hypothetical protein